MRYLDATLKLMGMYYMILGVFAVLFQSAAKFLFLFQVVDPVSTRLWGGTMVGVAMFYFMISYDIHRYHKLIWVGVVQ
ncbi:hypothetical protein ACFL0V_05140, partial [Nanoarchaeota archaeon]